MTSGTFTSYPTQSIFVDRPSRQRKQLIKIEELALSIKNLGLIHPLIVKKDGQLITGERRFEAVKMLGWTHVPVQFVDDLSDDELVLLELEENIKRENISWQEEVAAVARYHEIKLTVNEDWSHGDTAEELGESRTGITQKLGIAKEIAEGNVKVIEAQKYSVAKGLTERANARRKDSELENLVVLPAKEIIETQQEEKIINNEVTVNSVPLLNIDFLNFIKTYSGPKFNLLHCDFPYGIGADNITQGTAVQTHGAYADDEEIYWNLIHGIDYMVGKDLIADSAHMIFWFSMKYYEDTKEVLEQMGWRVLYMPLVWHKSCNTGILPDPNRGPRQTYETAFFCTRGDRKIVRAKANSFSGATSRRVHMSEKPTEMLGHFLSMLVDGETIMLDPTCGSANAVKVTEELGAKSVLGLEIDEELFEKAQENYYEDNQGQLLL